MEQFQIVVGECNVNDPWGDGMPMTPASLELFSICDIFHLVGPRKILLRNWLKMYMMPSRAKLNLQSVSI